MVISMAMLNNQMVRFFRNQFFVVIFYWDSRLLPTDLVPLESGQDPWPFPSDVGNYHGIYPLVMTNVAMKNHHF